MKVFCFGNEFFKEDSFAKELIDELKIDTIEFIKCNKIDDILRIDKKDVILDVVKDLREVKIIKVEDLKNNEIVSLHDFDLNSFLKLVKIVKKDEFKIVGVPQKGNKEDIKKELIKVLKAINK